MKKIVYLILIIGLLVLSCNKPPKEPEVQDVVFQATTDSEGLKSSCDNPIANFALIEIDETIHQIDVFYLNDKIYTNTLKLTPGEHTLKMFVLVNDGGSPDNPDGDIIVLAAPLSGNTFANFVSKPLPFDFTIDAFYKTEIPVELLRYEASDYEDFGFAWFSFEEIVIREFCFFGDICIDDYMSYTGSIYENQRNGLQHDMPAIFKIDVIRNGDTLITYSNAEWYGEGRPLCINYPDYSNYTDQYKFVLSILLKEDEVFNYVELYTWETTDAEPLPNIGADNILDFVMGDCVPDADIIIPPPEEPTPSTGSETAFAYGGPDYAICFLNDPAAPDNSRWGWTNGVYTTSTTETYTLELWAGAADCDQTKGTFVGTVTFTYRDGEAEVKYNIANGIGLEAVHLYVGNDKYPLNGIASTVAPGKFTFIDDDASDGIDTEITIGGLVGDVYIIAHADVNGINQ